MSFIENPEIFERRLAEIDSLILRHKRFPEQVFTGNGLRFSFFRFDDIFTTEFFEKIRLFLSSIGGTRFTLAVIEPHPEDYFFRHFKKYSVVDFPVSSTAEEVLRILEDDPGNSPADALVYNSNILVLYDNGLEWAVYADRDFELGIFGCVNETYKELFDSTLGEECVFDSVESIEQNVLPQVYSNRSDGVPDELVQEINANYVKS